MDSVRFSVVTTNACTTTNAPRLGILKRAKAEIRTPAFMFYTKGGSVPYVSREVFEKIVPNEQVVFDFPLPTNLNFYEPLKEFAFGLNKFVGLENYFSCCSVSDRAVNALQGYNRKDCVAVHTKYGNQWIDHNAYMDIMEVFKPTMYVTLCISDINVHSSFSAIEKSVNVSNRLFKSCLERHHRSKVLKGSGVIAPIQGGYNVQERIRSATFLSEYNEILGFLFDGFFTDGLTVEDITSDLIIPVIDKTMERLPNDKMKIIFGGWTPSLIIDLVNSGMDMFDSTFPYLSTQRNSALVFDYNLKYKNDCIVMDIPPHCARDENINKLHDYEICLKDKCHFQSFKPIKDSCECLTCKKHTRSYIHHLIVSNELLGSLLLTIHNLHYFNQFFKDIREVLSKSCE